MKVQWDWDLGGTQAGGEDNDRVELFSIEFMAYTDLVVGVSLGGGGEPSSHELHAHDHDIAHGNTKCIEFVTPLSNLHDTLDVTMTMMPLPLPQA